MLNQRDIILTLGVGIIVLVWVLLNRYWKRKNG